MPSNVARALDTSGVQDASVVTPYSGALRVDSWAGESTWSVTSGDLPPGLSMTPLGNIVGTPTQLGVWTVEVRATGMPFPDTTGAVTLRVVPGTMPVGLGYARNQLNNMSERDEPLLRDAWLRIANAGVTELSRYTLDVGLYAAGPDGVLEGGKGDDLLVGAVKDVAVTVGSWTGIEGQDTGDAIEKEAGTTFAAGEDTGELEFTLSHPDWPDATFRILALPPDWCPQGAHQGGPWAPGQCE